MAKFPAHCAGLRLVYIIGEVERSLNYNSKLEFQFCAMCPKLFILKEFYFLILESNMDHIINIYPSELLSTKTKEFRINESLKKKKCFAITKTKK